MELKSHIRKIVDDLENEDLLQTIYLLLQSRSSEAPGGMWDSLSVSQREEIMQAYEESFDEKNPLDAESLFSERL